MYRNGGKSIQFTQLQLYTMANNKGCLYYEIIFEKDEI